MSHYLLDTVPPWNPKRGAADERSRLRDLLILATAKAHHLGVATRNVDHFRGFGIPIYDPFTDSHLG